MNDWITLQNFHFFQYIDRRCSDSALSELAIIYAFYANGIGVLPNKDLIYLIDIHYKIQISKKNISCLVRFSLRSNQIVVEQLYVVFVRK